MRTLVVATSLLALSGCVGSWTGAGAEAFDVAKAACQQQAPNNRTAFESCMAERGWRRR